MISDSKALKVRHVMAVPGIGTFIAPKAVARLFSLTDYTRCPKFLPAQPKKQQQLSLFDTLDLEATPPVLYPLLLPNVLKSPRYYHVTTRAKARKEACRDAKA